MLDTDQITQYRGRKLIGSDGSKIGDIQEIYLDDESGRPEWVLVNTGLFGTKSHFVPVEAAQPDEDNLRVPFTKDTVKDAPSVEVDQHLSVEEEHQLYRHYGMEYEPVGEVGTAGREPVGHDTSGPNTDDAMTVSEERLDVEKERRPKGKARLRKHVVTDHVETTVPVEREEVRVVREPITDSNVDAATSGPAISEEEHEVTLSEEEVRVDKETVPRERVRLEKEAVVESRDVEADVRREEVDTETDPRR